MMMMKHVMSHRMMTQVRLGRVRIRHKMGTTLEMLIPQVKLEME